MRPLGIVTIAAASIAVATPAAAQTLIAPSGPWQGPASQTADRPLHPGAVVLTKAVPAAPADIRARATVRDRHGGYIGRIESVDAEGAVVRYSRGRTKVPLGAFGKDRLGLRMAVSYREFAERARLKPHTG